MTARSLAEAGIYTTDKYVKDILSLRNILNDLGISKELANYTIPIFNGTMTCGQWSQINIMKWMKHIQIKGNATGESVHNHIIKFYM